MRHDKIYIMAMAASGKSTFATANPVYRGYDVVDFAERLPDLSLLTRIVLYLSRLIPPLRKLVAGRADIVGRNRKNYFASVFDFMLEYDKPLVVLGRRTREDYPDLPVHDAVRFAMVLIPEEQHRKNCASRKRQLRNPFPMFHHWTTDFEKIQRNRRSMKAYAERHSVPVYEDFSSAIDDLMSRQGTLRGR